MVPAQTAFKRGEDEKAMRLFLVGVLGAEAYDRLSEASKQVMSENLSAARAQLLGAGFPPLDDDQVKSIRAPTLLITGEHSPAFLLRLTDRLEELLPNVERIEISDASHIMHEENAPAVNEAILAFIGRH
jgi:pimeloyl-ACP methyl ester carboxylesterase